MKASHPFSDHGMQMDGVGRIQLSKTWYNFTDTQDIRAVMGCKAHVNHKGQVKPVCFQMPECEYKQIGRHSLCYNGCRLVGCCNLYVAALIGPGHFSVLQSSIYLCPCHDCRCILVLASGSRHQIQVHVLFSATWQSRLRVSLSISKSCHVQMPYARLQENNWSLFINFRGYCGARYDL